MAKTDFKTVDEYHAQFPAQIRERLAMVREAIRKTAPKAEEVISYQIPAYKLNGFLIYYSAYTNHLSLSYPYSDALLKELQEELLPFKRSKSAIQFPHTEKLPIALIKKIVKYRLKEDAENAAMKATARVKKK